MSENRDNFMKCTAKNHLWPESIDIDTKGNLYFTDVMEGTLYRIKRNDDNTLERKEEILIEKLERASGIIIDREENLLYMAMRPNGSTRDKIISIPLHIFDLCTKLPLNFKELRNCADEKNIGLRECDVNDEFTHPNGIVLDKKNNVIYYTDERLKYLYRGKGHIGKVQLNSNKEPNIIKKFFTPNGIDIDPSSEETTLIVAMTFKNSFKRITLSNDEVKKSITTNLGKGGIWLLGHLPDGLLCMENGDILVAAFGSGKIFYSSWNGSIFGKPIEVANGLGHPTDLVIGPSSKGIGKSLFVTTKSSMLERKDASIAKGRVIEIEDIEKLIESKKLENDKTDR